MDIAIEDSISSTPSRLFSSLFKPVSHKIILSPHPVETEMSSLLANTTQVCRWHLQIDYCFRLVYWLE